MDNPREGLALSLTLPGEPRSAGIARNAITSALHAHRLDPYVLPIAHGVTELIAMTARLSPREDVYLSLRHRDDVLRLVVWDQHAQHADPDAVTLCHARRRKVLWLLNAVVDDWGGEWGICDARPPHRGTKSWVVLPR
ncbi:ATP-binding protein [Streptomyces sp. NPDC002133]|uniref:ATP-binding protein n=1 Tax=Streptomyces sp. NPDC002133 TaxID=3154409 RepID=UPI00331AB1B1